MPSGGGLLQLVAQGKQDVFLTGNPQFTYFKMIYKRHTNFSVEAQPISFEGTPDFGQRITCVIPRLGDLLGRTYLHVVLPRLTYTDTSGAKIPVSYVNSIGHALIQEISLEIGEHEIDRQTGEWMEIWSQLTDSYQYTNALDTMLGRTAGYAVPTLIPGSASSGAELYIPLQFFFCRNAGWYIPLLALQYHTVRINVTIAPLQTLFYTPLLVTNPSLGIQVNPAHIVSMQLWSDFVFLDTEERRRFVSSPHDYLIEQVQYTPLVNILSNQSIVNIHCHFNHPIREFQFVVQRDYMQQVNQPFNFSSLATDEPFPSAILSPYFLPHQQRTNLIASALLQLDGYDRFSVRPASYFTLIQPYEHHTNTPVDNFIHTYSFALTPEKPEPSGSINASRINSIIWKLTMNPILQVTGTTTGNSHARIYATNYNIFRVVDGFGGILFTI